MLKKGILIILALVLCFAGYVFFTKSEKGDVKHDKEIPLKISKNTDLLNQRLDSTLQAYYALHDGLVRWAPADSIGEMAATLSKIAATIPYTDIKADSLLVQTALSYGQNITLGCETIKKATDITDQRRAFYNTSEALYNLLRTVQYDKKTVYHIKCPMAFNGDEEGFWLSDSAKIINPYFGLKDPTYHSGMVHCGSVEDSIAFAQL